MFKFAYLLSAGLILGGAVFAEPAKAVTVDYTLTFAGKDGTKADRTGLLVINETSPLASFTENSYGDLVSLQATIGGLNFAPSSVSVDLGNNQTFYSLTGSSSPGVIGPKGLVETLVLGGFGFNITNPGGPIFDDGSFSIGPGVVATTPLPSSLLLFIGGLAALFLFGWRQKRRLQAA